VKEKLGGQSAILDIEASTNQNAAGIIPDERLVSSEYLWRWALAQYEVTRSAGRGGNQSALNKQRISELVIAVPRLDEQAEIVRRVDQLLVQSEVAAERIKLAKKKVESTSQAILAEAFNGELIGKH
jgi:type I restriction enzyme, S subunit